MRSALLSSLAFSLVASLLLAPVSTAAAPLQDRDEVPLPRWREGGTPFDPGQSLVPYAVRAGREPGVTKVAPGTGAIASPPEYSPSDGIILRYSSGSWSSVVVDCVVALTQDPAHDEKAYVVVSSTSQMNSAVNAFTAAGADMSKVLFWIEPTNSIWLRDYGPHFVWQQGTRVVADSHYYPTRPLDNFIPTLVAENHMVVPPYAMGLYYSGGNFQPGPARSGFVTALVRADNPDMSDQLIADLYRDYQGIDTLHILPQLPGSVDATGHIDMWMYLVDEDTVIISQFKPGSNATAIQITENAVPYMQGLGFDVLRVPAWNVGYTHYTYTNAFRVNDRIFVPIYGPGNANYLADDQQALAAWSAAAGPGVEIVPINCYSIIPAAGAIHCIVMQVPRVTDPQPAACVLSPKGDELVIAGFPYQVRWVASDDVAVRSVDLDYSLDGGASFPYSIATKQRNDGLFTWNVPFTLGTNAVLRVRARDTAANWAEAVSETSFELARARKAVYDFKTGAGVNKWAWGQKTSNWSSVAGVRYPATDGEIDVLVAGAYSSLASSDASGGENDANRYVSPYPGNGWESTHVFEFTINQDPGCILDLELLWEGYGGSCLQMEMYVWDNVAGDWCNAQGTIGSNAYLENWAGNVDRRLSAHIRNDIARYIDGNGRLTMLLYAERPTQRSLHDYVSVTTTFQTCP